MPSRREGLPLVSIQAAQMARPVVAARVGGLPEVVVDGETGLLIDPEDSAALAQAIAFLLDHPDRATQMGQAARQRAELFFGWTRYLDSVEELYYRLAVHNAVTLSASE